MTVESALEVLPARLEVGGGAALVAFERPGAAMATLLAAVPAGNVDDLAGEEGISYLAGSCLERGTRRRNHEDLFGIIDGAGAILEITPGAERLVLELRALAEDLPRLIPLAAEILREPSFAADDVEIVRREILTGIREDLDDTREVALDIALEILYGPGHPFARRASGTVESVERIAPARLAAFHAAHYGLEGCAFGYAGPHDPRAVRDLVAGAFGGWTRAPRDADPSPLPSLVAPPSVARRGSRTMPHKEQADITVAYPVPPRAHPDFPALMLANMVLGEFGLGGRIGREVRDARGLAYDAHARLPLARGPRAWVARIGTSAADVETAIDVLLAEVRRLAEEEVPPAEIEDARGSIVGSLPVRLETLAGFARAALQMEFYGLGIDYLVQFPGRIRALGPEDVMRVARTYWPADRASIGVAGP
ncbi:MAG: insulinase family protein [Planctomycetes bacterium]|nr:insulinase family protein [Planctomycetota bacterium]